MSRDTLPINPRILKWARERAGLTIEEASQSVSGIGAWEAGEGAPTYPQLERLARLLKIPIAVFFFSELPDVPLIRESFRTLPDSEFEEMPPRIQFLLRKAKAMQLNLEELCDGRNPSARLITRDVTLQPDSPNSVMAARIREYLGITLDEQFSWHDTDSALKAWRNAVQGSGVFVFKDAFRENGYSGFSLHDDVFPIIYINNSSAKSRQVFTLLHELAHLLFHTSGIDVLDQHYIDDLQGDKKQIEIASNRIASHVLIPEAAFDEAVGNMDHSLHTAEIIASRFSVSREAIYRKFLDRRWIDQGEYLRAAEEWVGQLQGGGGDGGDYYWTKIAYLGSPYIELALTKYYQNRIDDTKLAEYLDTKARNVATLADRFQRANR